MILWKCPSFNTLKYPFPIGDGAPLDGLCDEKEQQQAQPQSQPSSPQPRSKRAEFDAVLIDWPAAASAQLVLWWARRGKEADADSISIKEWRGCVIHMSGPMWFHASPGREICTSECRLWTEILVREFEWIIEAENEGFMQLWIQEISDYVTTWEQETNNNKIQSHRVTESNIPCKSQLQVQGVPSAFRSGLGWLEYWVFQCPPNSILQKLLDG